MTTMTRMVGGEWGAVMLRRQRREAEVWSPSHAQKRDDERFTAAQFLPAVLLDFHGA